MPDYSKINLLEIESSSKDEKIETHFARKYLDSRDIGVSLFRYAPNYKAEMSHNHKIQEEVYIVVKGSGQILLNNKTIDLKVWDAIRVAPEVIRAFEAGPEGLDIIAVGGPKPEEGDGVRHEANWPAS